LGGEKIRRPSYEFFDPEEGGKDEISMRVSPGGKRRVTSYQGGREETATPVTRKGTNSLPFKKSSLSIKNRKVVVIYHLKEIGILTKSWKGEGRRIS